MPANLSTVRKYLLITICMMAFSAQLSAADNQGQFALRGAGLIPCALLVQERKASSEVYLIAASWVDGYISGVNQYAPGTYDALSFETTELIMSIVDKHCKNNPRDPVFGVINTLIKKLHTDRLVEKAEKTEWVAGERKVSLYTEVVKRAQQVLHNKGFYKDKIDGRQNKSMVEGLKQYQRSIELNATGFPDQLTLWRLLRGPA